LTLEKVEMGATLNNNNGVILNAMGIYEGLTSEAMGPKLICLRCDVDSMF
jgi:hypothetical protein